MKVGDYVRTKEGIIGTIKEQNEKYVIVPYKTNELFVSKDTIKSSPNIIDLIEVGDYVNGSYVLDFETLQTREKVIIVDGLVTYGWGQGVIPISEIKSIVTKEQFESMEYKI